MNAPGIDPGVVMRQALLPSHLQRRKGSLHANTHVFTVKLKLSFSVRKL